MTQNTSMTKEKNKLNCVNIKNFGATSDATEKVKGQRLGQEKTFVNNMSNKGLVLEYIRKFYSSKTKTK